MKRTILSLLATTLISPSALGQAEQVSSSKGLFNKAPRPVYYNEQMRSFQIGAGGLLLKDSYLSPLNYGGYTLSVLSERSHFGYRSCSEHVSSLQANLLPSPWRTSDTRYLHHQVLTFDYGTALSPARNASIRRLQFRLDRSLTYRALFSAWGVLFVGGGFTAGVGGHYHSRNGNNPATAKVDLALTANVLYTYQAPWGSFPARLTLHNTTELLGLAFAQGFGENYYELYRYEESVLSRLHLTLPTNRLANQTRLRLDLPVWDYMTLSLGYRLQVRTSQINHTANRQIDHTAYIGFVSHLRPLGGRLQAADALAPLPF